MKTYSSEQVARHHQKLDMDRAGGLDWYHDRYKGNEYKIAKIPVKNIPEANKHLGSEDEPYAKEYSKRTESAPPVILHPKGDGHEIMDGRHRARAAALAGKTHINAFVPVERAMKKSDNLIEQFDKPEICKSYNLDKSKNVREQRKKVFGSHGDPAKGTKHHAAQMDALKRLAAKRYPGWKVEQGEGKKKTSAGKEIDKPSYEGGKIQYRQKGGPSSLVHEMAHLETDPQKKGESATKYQKRIDKRWGEQNKKPAEGGYGYKQHARAKTEYEPMGAEQQIRRRAGIPATQKETATKPPKTKKETIGGKKVKRPLTPKETKESKKRIHERQYAVDAPGKKITHDVKTKTGRTKRLTALSSNISPKGKKMIHQVDAGEVTIDPKKGPRPSDSVHGRINRREREAAARPKHTQKKPRVPKTGKKLHKAIDRLKDLTDSFE
jgi:hypothetical protein